MSAGFTDAVFSPLPDVIRHTFSLQGALWLLVTVTCYVLALRLHLASRGNPLLHPLVVTACLVGGVTALTQTPMTAYREYASLLHWLLGPATVALALPMFNQWQKIRHLGWRLPLAIGIGGVIAPVLAWTSLFIADAPTAMQLTMLLKSITTPLAMEASRLIGGVPELAAVFVIVTGIVGAMACNLVFRLTGVTDEHAKGIALGSVAHAVGTARALQLSEQAGAMSTLGLCVNGIMTAIIIPLLLA
ncbi:LrgB family protein [Alteromonas sp. CYL-A6]|uniref:LrgB family protein n=1 Tax=Alteromonas nitratireducens TaxID=3390813 RepID=UPI0034AC0191